MIDPRLRVLQLVAHHGTVTAAAEALNYTPPAVSHQMKQLSEELGVPLLAPQGRGVRLTKEARVLLRHVDVLFEQAERAYADISTEAEGGTFTLCGFSTAASLLPPVTTAMRERFPQVKVRVVQASPSRCLNLLLTGEAGLALLPATADLPDRSDHRFDQQQLLDDPLDLLVHDDHPLARREQVELADAAEEPWIVGHPGSPYLPLMMSACLAAGFTPRAAHIIEEWDVTLAQVAQGSGVTLIPRMVYISEQWRVTRVPLHGRTAPSRTIVSLTRRGSRGRRLISAAMHIIETNIATRQSGIGFVS